MRTEGRSIFRFEVDGFKILIPTNFFWSYEMSLATLSPEAKLRDALIEVRCPESTFAKIAGVVGKTRLTEGLTDPAKSFDPHDAQRMLAVIDEMKELVALSQGQLDWKDTDAIRIALGERRQVRAMLAEVNRVVGEWSNLVTRNK
jgi:hypothetical protein